MRPAPVQGLAQHKAERFNCVSVVTTNGPDLTTSERPTVRPEPFCGRIEGRAGLRGSTSSPRTDQTSPRANFPRFGLSPSVEGSKAELGYVVRQAHHERMGPATNGARRAAPGARSRLTPPARERSPATPPPWSPGDLARPPAIAAWRGSPAPAARPEKRCAPRSSWASDR